MAGKVASEEADAGMILRTLQLIHLDALLEVITGQDRGCKNPALRGAKRYLELAREAYRTCKELGEQADAWAEVVAEAEELVASLKRESRSK